MNQNMFSYIKCKYKKGDKLRLLSNNADVSGEILAINEHSIIIKSVDGNVYGIKDDDICFFKELSVGAPGESELIDNANHLLKKKGFVCISYNDMYKANKHGDYGNRYYIIERDDEIRINIDTIGFTGKAKDLKEIIESKYNNPCEFDIEIENSKNEYLNIKGNKIGLGIGEPRWWFVEILENSFENPELLERQIDDYYVLCYLTFKKGQFQFVDDLCSELKK